MDTKIIIIAIVVIAIILSTFVLYYLTKKPGIYQKYYYFDANGTTPIHDSALKAYNDSAYLGNASAEYADEAREIIKEATDCLRDWLNHPDLTVVFNSGASEGNNQVLNSFAVDNKRVEQGPFPVPHFILSSIEHKTSLECAKHLESRGQIQVSYVHPNSEGIITAEDVAREIRPTTHLISVMAANNETGNINDIYGISRLAQQNGIKYHCDAVQMVGKFPIDMSQGPDIITGSFHKFHGPSGCGFVAFNPQSCKIMCQIHGSQFGGLRGGTENVPAIAAALVAMRETFSDRNTKNSRMRKMRNMLLGELIKPYTCTNMRVLDVKSVRGQPEDYVPPVELAVIPITNIDNSVPNTLAISFCSNRKLLCKIDMRDSLKEKGIIVNIGSACNSSQTPNHVMEALRLPRLVRAGYIRISMSDYNTESEARYLASSLRKVIRDILKEP